MIWAELTCQPEATLDLIPSFRVPAQSVSQKEWWHVLQESRSMEYSQKWSLGNMYTVHPSKWILWVLKWQKLFLCLCLAPKLQQMIKVKFSLTQKVTKMRTPYSTVLESYWIWILILPNKTKTPSGHLLHWCPTRMVLQDGSGRPGLRPSWSFEEHLFWRMYIYIY